MADSIIQEFLNAQFIKTDDPTHIASLIKASAVIQKNLVKKKALVINYSLVAFDPTISSSEPVVNEVEAIIVKTWPAFKNSVVKVKDTPLVYIQAVILDALYKLSKDELYAALVWYSSNNVIQHYKLAGQKSVLLAFLSDIGRSVEVAAQKKWNVLNSSIVESFDAPSVVLSDISSVGVSPKLIEEHLKAASIHNSWGEGGESPFTTNQGNVNWPKFFSERAASGLAKEFNKALVAQNKSLGVASSQIQDAIQTYLSELQPYLEEISSSLFLSSNPLVRRSDLLWWKESLYSSCMDDSYRNLKPLSVSIAMSVDLALSTPLLHPKCVDYFLKEALFDVIGDDIHSKRPIIDILTDMDSLSATEKKLLNACAAEGEGRNSFNSCLAKLLKGDLIPSEFMKTVGLGEKETISLGELAVWLCHDQKASMLAKVK